MYLCPVTFVVCLVATNLRTCPVITPRVLRTDVAQTLYIYLDARYGEPTIERHVRGDADKSLTRTTSRCRRTESIVSLERGVCSCADLQDFSLYRG